MNKALGRGSGEGGVLGRTENVQRVCQNKKKKRGMQKFGEELREKNTAAREGISFARGKFLLLRERQELHYAANTELNTLFPGQVFWM